jgi:hypothetical protein
MSLSSTLNRRARSAFNSSPARESGGGAGDFTQSTPRATAPARAVVLHADPADQQIGRELADLLRELAKRVLLRAVRDVLVELEEDVVVGDDFVERVRVQVDRAEDLSRDGPLGEESEEDGLRDHHFLLEQVF